MKNYNAYSPMHWAGRIGGGLVSGVVFGGGTDGAGKNTIGVSYLFM